MALALRNLANRDAGHPRDDAGYVVRIDDIRPLAVMGHPEPDHRPCLVHHVDGLVRQCPVGDVAVGLPYAGLDGLGGVFHVMEVLVILLQVAQYVYGLGNIRRFYHDFQETPVEGAVLLNDFGELVHGGGADALDLPPCKGRLEHVGGVEAALGTAGTDNGMELVDEEYYVGIGLEILDDALEAFLEVSAIASAGHY